jgi:hypothetical protein
MIGLSRFIPVEQSHSNGAGAVNAQLVHTEVPTYVWNVTAAAVGADKLYADLFNATGSGRVLRILELLVIPKLDVAVTGLLGVRVDSYRTSAVGTGGTAWAVSSATRDVAGGSVSPLDTNNPALPAQVTGRALPSGGATIAAWLATEHAMGEEGITSGAYARRFDQLNLKAEFGQVLTLREGQGLLLKQGAVASAGNMSFQIVFSVTES